MIIVTGAYGQIGRSIVATLLSNGSDVIGVGRDSEALGYLAAKTADLPGKLVPLRCDAGQDGLIEEAFAIAESIEKSVEGLVNNAHSRQSGPLLGSLSRPETEDAVKALSDVILLTDRFSEEIARMKKTATIVNIASMYGIRSPQPDVYDRFPEYHNPPIYGAVKAGIIQFSRYAAVHLAPLGIRVNCISPGPIPFEGLPHEFITTLASRTPLGKVGKPADIASAVQFLMSENSEYIVGHNLVVDGGWTVW